MALSIFSHREETPPLSQTPSASLRNGFSDELACLEPTPRSQRDVGSSPLTIFWGLPKGFIYIRKIFISKCIYFISAKVD